MLMIAMNMGQGNSALRNPSSGGILGGSDPTAVIAIQFDAMAREANRIFNISGGVTTLLTPLQMMSREFSNNIAEMSRHELWGMSPSANAMWLEQDRAGVANDWAGRFMSTGIADNGMPVRELMDRYFPTLARIADTFETQRLRNPTLGENGFEFNTKMNGVMPVNSSLFVDPFNIRLLGSNPQPSPPSGRRSFNIDEQQSAPQPVG